MRWGSVKEINFGVLDIAINNILTVYFRFIVILILFRF